MKHLIKSTFFAASLLVFSCTDLEEELIGDVTADVSLPALTSGGSGGGGGSSDPAAGAYTKLRESGSAGHGGIFAVNGVSSDEMAIAQKGGDWYDGGIWLDMHRHTYSAGNGPLKDVWNNQYGAIAEVNRALSATNAPGAQAELKTLRAFFHWRLLDLYGRIRYIKENNAASASQLDRAAGFAEVEGDLLAALGITRADVAAGLSDGDFSSDLSDAQGDSYRINRWGALGILAKVYLNAEVYTGSAFYQHALNVAEYIVVNGPYQIHSNYAELFAPDNDSNGSRAENIFTIPYDETTGPGMNFAQMTLTYTSQQTWDLEAQPWNGYAALQEFYDSYDANDARKANNFLYGVQRKWGENGANTGDALLDFSFDDDSPVVDYNYNKPAPLNGLEPNGGRDYGARLGKFGFKRFQRPEMDNDYPLVRLTEMHLIIAEGILRGATSSAGLTVSAAMGPIRSRAGLGAMPETLDELFDERGREMFMEQTRRQDLIRFGKWSDAWWEKAANASGDHPVMPIPQAAIDTGNFTQNSQY